MLQIASHVHRQRLQALHSLPVWLAQNSTTRTMCFDFGDRSFVNIPCALQVCWRETAGVVCAMMIRRRILRLIYPYLIWRHRFRSARYVVSSLVNKNSSAPLRYNISRAGFITLVWLRDSSQTHKCIFGCVSEQKYGVYNHYGVIVCVFSLSRWLLLAEIKMNNSATWNCWLRGRGYLADAAQFSVCLFHTGGDGADWPLAHHLASN